MKKYTLKKDIKVFYITAASFPNGVLAAHQQLRSKLTSTLGRRYFGISSPNPAGNIIYKAAVEELNPGEADKLGCETFVIRKGEYISETLENWQKDETIVGKTFKKLLAYPQIDTNGYCLEMYIGDSAMICLVGLESVKA